MDKLWNTLANVTADEWRVFLAIVVSLCAIVGYFTYGWARARGYNDGRKGIDRDNVAVVNIAFRELPGYVEIRGITPPELPTLDKVFGSARLQALVRKHVTHVRPGQPLLPRGAIHHSGMERIHRHITGDDTVATEDAVDENHGAYVQRNRAFMLTALKSDDGMMMPHVIKVNPGRLVQMLDADFVARLVPHRQSHAVYIEAMVEMAKQYELSRALFAEATLENEIEIGQQAPVWTAEILTRKTPGIEQALDALSEAA
ncbi:hypothetical protein EBR66_03060 [bacterium]|nr:hypothetical protein [bacterium]